MPKKKDLLRELIAPEDSEEVGYDVYKILAEILKDKEALGLPKKWGKHYELSRNVHWKTTTAKIPLLSANLLFSHRLRTVNMLTDNNPTFNIAKIGDDNQENEERYNDLLHTCEFWWHDQEQQHILEKSVTDGETYGCTIEKVFFDPQIEFGMGEVVTELVDPFYFGFYPVDCMDSQKCDANLHYWPMSIREARRRWPQHAEKIVSEDEYLKTLGDERREIQRGQANKGYFSTFGTAVKNMMSTFGMTDDALSENLLIVEAWVKDYTEIEVEVPLINPDNGEPVLDEEDEPIIEIELQPKYPGNIRCIWTCNGGEVVLDDQPNPSINSGIPVEESSQTYLFDKFPFTLTQSITDNKNPWGMSDYEQLDSLQKEINKSMSQFTLLKDKAARLKLINPKDSGVKNSELTNYPGILNPSNTMVAQGIRYMDPPQIPADLIKALEIYKDLFFLVSGSFDLEQAQTQGREVIAYKAIAALLERATTMLKGKLRNYGKMIRYRGRMYISHVQNWYLEPRYITYEDEGQDASKVIVGRNLITPAKLVVVSGSTMPISKVQEREEALALFQMQAIDVEELLKKLDWPDRKTVLKRLRQGPLSAFYDMLRLIGVPDQLVQYFQMLANEDIKNVEKGLESGEIPDFFTLLEQVLTGEDAQLDQTKQLEMAKDAAEIEKVKEETKFITAKIRSEQVQQEVAMKGVAFDAEKIKMEKAKTVLAIKESGERISLEIGKMLRDTETKLSKILSDHKIALTKSSEERSTTGIKGIKSDNKV